MILHDMDTRPRPMDRVLCTSDHSGAWTLKSSSLESRTEGHFCLYTLFAQRSWLWPNLQPWLLKNHNACSRLHWCVVLFATWIQKLCSSRRHVVVILNWTVTMVLTWSVMWTSIPLLQHYIEILCNVALYIAVCYIGHTEARQSHCNWTGADWQAQWHRATCFQLLMKFERLTTSDKQYIATNMYTVVIQIPNVSWMWSTWKVSVDQSSFLVGLNLQILAFLW